MRANIFKRIFYFYYDGFRSMTVGKKLWVIIFIKLFIFFIIMKLIFFPDFLNSRFKTDREKSNYILEQLTK
jgi:hypothetical protein